MIQGNLALKLEDFDENYNYPHLVDDSDKIPPDNIIQFPTLTAPDSKVTNYSYDSVSNLTNMSLPNSTEVNYQFNSLNRLLTLTNKKTTEEVISSYSCNYDPAGMRTSVGLADNSQIGYQYDNLNRLIDETKTLSDTTEDYFNRYTFDAVGNRLTQIKIEKIEPTIGTADFDPNTLNVNSSGNFVTVYLTPLPQATDKAWITQINGEDIHPIKAEEITSDSVKFNRASVSEASKPYIGSNVTYTIFWLISDDVYTAETDQIKIIEKGNKGKGKGKKNNTLPPPTTDLPPVLQQVIEVAYTYNAENQLTQETITPENETTPTKTITYSYDNNGNLVEKNDSVEGITTYAYDYENRLVAITYHDGSSSQYVYDGVGKRIKSIENGQTIKYLYDGLNVIIEQDANDQTIATYTRGISYGGGIGGIISRATATETNYYHYDGLGTVTGLTDVNESVVQTYVYDAYGNLLSSTGSETNTHLFSTKELSSKSGLVYFGARYYDPKIGRWISKDPLGMIDGPNVYLYVRNNPVNWIDPWGLYWFRQPWQKRGVVGRPNTPVPPRGPVSEVIEKYVPAGYTFGVMHDAFVDATRSAGLPDWLVNRPSMLLLYQSAQIVELLRSLGILDQPKPPEKGVSYK